MIEGDPDRSLQTLEKQFTKSKAEQLMNFLDHQQKMIDHTSRQDDDVISSDGSEMNRDLCRRIASLQVSHLRSRTAMGCHRDLECFGFDVDSSLEEPDKADLTIPTRIKHQNRKLASDTSTTRDYKTKLQRRHSSMHRPRTGLTGRPRLTETTLTIVTPTTPLRHGHSSNLLISRGLRGTDAGRLTTNTKGEYDSRFIMWQRADSSGRISSAGKHEQIRKYKLVSDPKKTGSLRKSSLIRTYSTDALNRQKHASLTISAVQKPRVMKLPSLQTNNVTFDTSIA